MNARIIRIAGAALLAGAVLAAAASGRQSSRTVDGSISTHVGTLDFEAYLPADYDTSTLHYPVIYFLHGLPAGSTAYLNVGWVERALDAAGLPAILVAPQGSTDSDRDPEYI